MKNDPPATSQIGSRGQLPSSPSPTTGARRSRATKTIQTAADLAINGAPPLFRILACWPAQYRQPRGFLNAPAASSSAAGFPTTGPFAQEFEKRIADFSASSTASRCATARLRWRSPSARWSLKGEVIVPSYTFVATAHALQWQEITPVFADIDPATHNLDPRPVERMITPRTTGIIGVHLWGRAAPVEACRRSPTAARSAADVRRRPRASAARMAAAARRASATAKCSAFMPPSSSTRSRAARSSPTTTSSPRRCG